MFYTQKIYINNKPLILTNSAENYMLRHPVSSGYLFLKGAFVRNFRMAQKHLEKYATLGVVIEDISVEALTQTCEEVFPAVAAAGGVVNNKEGGILMIFRRGRWDLPKGKLDEGESLEECAIREVIEETGLPAVALGDKICETNHVYARSGQQYLKVTHWFHMTADKSSQLYPQREENILEAKWIRPEKISLYLHQSYEAIKEVLSLNDISGKFIH